MEPWLVSRVLSDTLDYVTRSDEEEGMAEVQLLLKRVMDHKKAAGRKKEAAILQVGKSCVITPCEGCFLWATPAIALSAHGQGSCVVTVHSCHPSASTNVLSST